MSVTIHGFTEISKNVFVENSWSGDTKELQAIISAANLRIEDFFGETTSNPVIIICDDEKKLGRLGGDHDTMTFAINGANSYLSLSSEWLNIDVLSHELTHAEIHSRVYRGKAWFTVSIPTWFDEGLAIQNDYREQYSYDTWLSITDNGENVPEILQYDTPQTFYSGTSDDRKTRYCLAGHEVGKWINENGMEALFEMLNAINNGEDFTKLYFIE